MTSYNLDEILTRKQTDHVIRQWMADKKLQGLYTIISSEVKKFAEGLSGFLGDHLRVTLHMQVQGSVRKVHLFVKCLPLANKPKSELIKEWNFFVREKVMYQIFESLGGTEGKNAWRPKSYICNDSIVVLPDLTAEGFVTHPKDEHLDLEHSLLTAASIARFHAAQINSDARKPSRESIIEKYGHLITESNWMDSPWLRAGARLTSDLIKQFSTKPYNNTDLENSLTELYLSACDSVKEYADELNVIIHKDLWTNNLFFKYTNSKPETCLLIDYQCVRIAPPAFDIMMFIYLNTSGKIRACHEEDVLAHYYSVFMESLEPAAKKKCTGYSYKVFTEWCNKARMFSMLVPIGIFPYTLIDPITAQRTYDNPATFDHVMNVDRSAPVMAYARAHPEFRDRMLEISEEFVERFVFKTF